jgi:hypothetical protein
MNRKRRDYVKAPRERGVLAIKYQYFSMLCMGLSRIS